MKLVLASSSPRRREVLEKLGLSFDVQAPNVDETRFPDESPGAYVERVARSKASAVVATDLVVVAADTTVVVDGRVLGKPGHPEEGRSMLRRLQGRKHEVFTGLALSVGPPDEHLGSIVAATEVEMVPMTDEEVVRYVASGEPMDKAGAYALQGYGGVFVAGVVGSPSNVIGLPVHLLPMLFHQAGLELDQFLNR